MLTFDLDPEPVTLTLKCDDSPEAERVRWTLRPLTAPELDRARASAGPRPVRGFRVLQEMGAAASKALDPETARALRRAHEEALPPEDVAAVAQAVEWLAAHNLALVCAALTHIDGAAVDARRALEGIRPASMQAEVVQELAAHVLALAELSPKARSTYASRCGSAGTPTDAGGSAPTAPETPGS